MERCAPSTSVFHEAVLVSLEHMSYVELVRLSACNKLTRDVIAGQLRCGDRSLARSLLRSVLQGAGATGHDAQQTYQPSQAVEWLLRTADIPPARLAEENYLNIPGVPVSICKRLLVAGARVTNNRLILASRQRVQGVGNWVRGASENPEPLRGLHLAVELLFCPLLGRILGLTLYHFMLRNLRTDMAEDLLYVFVNSFTDDVIFGQHAVNMFCDLLEMSPAAQQLSAHSYAQLLQFMIEVDADRGRLADWLVYTSMFQLLYEMPRMQQMNGADAYDFVSTAIKCRTEDLLLLHILKVPGVKRLTADNICGLFATVLQLPQLPQQPSTWLQSHELVHALCYAPAASTIAPDSRVHLVEMLLNLQWRHGSNRVLDCRHLATHLIELPGMEQLNTAGVTRLMKAVLQIGGLTRMARLFGGDAVDLIDVVCSLPGANSIDPPVLQELLLLAEELGASVQGRLLQLPAAQKLPATRAVSQQSTAQQPHSAQHQPARQQLPVAQR